MSTLIQYTHNETVITYDESRNVWSFTMRDQDRSTESLAKAKEFIDRPEPVKAKPFEKIPAWIFKYSEGPKRVEVTGIAEGHSSRQKVWIKNSKGGGSKEDVAYYIYPSNTENDDKVSDILEKMKEIKAIEKRVSELKESLQPLKIESED